MIDITLSLGNEANVFSSKLSTYISFKFLGLYCNRTWDGWLCWDDTPAGEYADKNCPNYFQDFDPTGIVPLLLSTNRWNMEMKI